MIFDVIVCSSWQELGDLRPTVAQLLVGFNDQVILLLRPLILLDVRVQVVVPSNKHEKVMKYLSLHCFPILPGREVAI